MTRIRWEGWASIDLPQGWTHEGDLQLLNFFKENGAVGAMQMSFARRNRDGAPTIDEAVELARSFTNQRGWKVESSDLSLGLVEGCPCAMFRYVDSDSTFWQVWHIVDAERVAFITYVSENEDAELERVDRETIVKSFRWE